jgi:hypothetical protein
MQSGWVLFAVVSVGWSVYAPEASADEDVRTQVEHLLTLATEPSLKNFQAVEGYYQSLPAASRNDRQLIYAYAVALIRQRHLHESAKLIDRLTDEQPQLAFLWRDRVWLALAMGQKTAAMTELEQLAAHARAHQAAEHESICDSETGEFLGAVCGFISGPWSQKVRAPDAQQLEDRLSFVFDEESRHAFDRAKRKTLERYEELLKVHDQRANAERQARTNEREAVDRAAKQLGDKQQALKDKEAKRTADAKTKIDDLDGQLRKIDDQRQSLFEQIAPLETERAALVSQMLPDPRLSLAAMGVRSGIAVPRWGPYPPAAGARNRAIMRRLAPLVARLTDLEAQVVLLNQREQELRFEQQATDVKCQVDVGKLSVKKQSLEKDRQRIQNDARRLKANSRGSTPRLRAEAEQMTNFSTYVPFPFERERERLLSQLR